MAGKWKVAELTPTRVDTPDGSISVSWVNNFDGGVRERKAEAVARLIAAAPDLLETSQRLQWIRANGCSHEEYEAATLAHDNAIAAATECGTCERDGVFATDSSGPFDCYICGKQARATQPLPPPNEE